jgi:hypothetical protein
MPRECLQNAALRERIVCGMALWLFPFVVLMFRFRNTAKKKNTKERKETDGKPVAAKGAHRGRLPGAWGETSQMAGPLDVGWEAQYTCIATHQVEARSRPPV